MDDMHQIRLNGVPTSAEKKSICCDECGAYATTKWVAFGQVIGMVIVFRIQTVRGNLCKSCIHEHFWEYTLVTLVFGWWGVMSFLMTPFVLLNNVIRYVLCLRMPPVPREQPASLAAAAKPSPATPAADQPWWTVPVELRPARPRR